MNASSAPSDAGEGSESAPGHSTWRAQGGLRRRLLIPVVALVLIATPLLWLALSSRASGGESPDASAALAYARQQMVWIQGPHVRSVHTVPLNRLEGALAAYAPPNIRNDVNVSELVHRYGPRLDVAVVMLSGDFNSLPPDEGVVLHDAIVLVNARTHGAFFLTD